MAKKKSQVLPSQTTDITPQKARKILEDKTVRGHPLTPKQRGFFGAVAGKSKKR